MFAKLVGRKAVDGQSAIDWRNSLRKTFNAHIALGTTGEVLNLVQLREADKSAQLFTISNNPPGEVTADAWNTFQLGGVAVVELYVFSRLQLAWVGQGLGVGG